MADKPNQDGAPAPTPEQEVRRLYEEAETPAVVEAIRSDPKLTGRQRQAMLEVYRAFTAPAARGRARRPPAT